MATVGRLHLVTDHRLGPQIPELVAAAVAGGVHTVQVRVAGTTCDRQALALTRELLGICRQFGATCLVNDRVGVALAAEADGVHLGADDLPVATVRRILGDRAVVGATARDPVTARRAQDDGASYLGTGPFRATRTKQGLPPPLGVTGVAAVVTAVQIPVIAIGGIVASDLPTLLAAGAHGAAMVSTFSEAPDPAAVLAELRAALGPAGASSDDVAVARRLQVAAARGLREGAWTSR
jgi:thiamine-phosphate pyrophosphorylase